VGSRGDSYDNALAETINGPYKAELIHRRAPWKTKESVELAILEWVSWFNPIACSSRSATSCRQRPRQTTPADWPSDRLRWHYYLNQLASTEAGAVHSKF